MKKIIIIDDEELLRESLSFLLKDLYEVESFPDCESAVSSINDQNIECILLDKGVCCDKFLEKSELLQLKVIFISGELLDDSIGNFIQKPFTKEELFATINKVCNNS